MNVVEYIKDKFNPTRPMGRKNYFLSTVACIILIFPVLFFLIPEAKLIPVSAKTGLLIELINAPLSLLQLRRAKAAQIPVAIVVLGWIFDFIVRVSIESPINIAISIYVLVVMACLLLLKNKVKPVAP